MKLFAFSCATLLACARLLAAPASPFPFLPPWDDASPGIINLSSLLDKPAGRDGFVTVRDGHLFAGEKRIRFFGVNVAFGANFPSHEDAPKIVARMAKFGINCVRFHHMDNRSAPDGIWSADQRTLDPAQLDRLDFFIAQLKANGIYANLNLHVSRAYPGMPTGGSITSYYKGVDLFYQPMVELQRDYARQLLRHVNPYTGKAYAEEPAVAIVEINNENGLIRDWLEQRLDDIPEVYRADLQRRWNGWLAARYGSREQLAAAWSRADEPLGRELLKNGNFEEGPRAGWYLEHHFGAEATAATGTTPSGKALEVEVQKTGAEEWHVQLSQNGLELQKGKPYTLTFRASAQTKLRKLTVVAMQAHAPWERLWAATVPLKPGGEWQDYRLGVLADADEKDARIVFTGLGTETGRYRFADVSLRTGGTFGLRPDEQPGAIPLLTRAETRSPETQRDWMRFLWKLEEDFWTGMRRFLKEELKTHSVIVGTAADYSPPPIQAELDAVDSHAYWQHPQFPHKGWDPEDWIVNNVAMAGVPGGGTLSRLAFHRVAGKPFLCTEYNAPAPNSYTAETFLLSNAYAALQDWDGLFAFAYSHRADRWNPGAIPGFFDIDQHPAKMATLPAAVCLFLRGDVARARTVTSIPYPPKRALDMALQGGHLTAKWFGLDERAWLDSLVQLDLSGTEAAPAPAAKPVLPEIQWDTERQAVTINTPRSKAFIGQGAGGPVSLGGVKIEPPNEWAVITLTAMDGRDFQSPGRVLITAVANVENTGMGWKNAEKTSVGKAWGKPPVLAWGVEARITLPLPAKQIQAWALDERGARKEPLPVEPDATGTALKIGPTFRTLWYEVDVKP